ncbi:MAG: pyrroline-5-carboxylate reductase [Acidimicrobiia bacterium]
MLYYNEALLGDLPEAVHILGDVERPSICIIGMGAMGTALFAGLTRGGWAPSSISMVVRRSDQAEELAEKLGGRSTQDPVEGIEGSDVIVLAVKPRDVRGVIDRLAGHLGEAQLVLSLAAGVSTRMIEEVLGAVPVVRAMPNTPALVGAGITGISGGAHTDEDAVVLAEGVLSAVGEVVRMDESLLDAVTAVSGTGPAYAFLLAEALTEAALREGIPHYLAETLVHHTLRGAGSLLIETDLTPFELRTQVTSPGGTTAAAMHILEERGFRALIEDAVRAAAARSRELGERASAEDSP